MVGFFQAATEREEQFEVKLRRISGEAEQEPESLTSALHELRLHEKYLLLGIDGEQNLSLGMIVVIDLAEQGSETLYPLLDALFERMADEPGAYIYLLCKTATFEFDPARDQKRARCICIWKNWRKLRRRQAWDFKPICSTRGRRLAGAKNEYEIGVLIQNFLLALLSGRLAQSSCTSIRWQPAIREKRTTTAREPPPSAMIHPPSRKPAPCDWGGGARCGISRRKIPDPRRSKMQRDLSQMELGRI